MDRATLIFLLVGYMAAFIAGWLLRDFWNAVQEWQRITGRKSE